MISVECTRGDERDIRPERFVLAGRTLTVEEVLDRWFGNTYTYFKVRVEDGHTYIMKHNRLADSWEIVFSETEAQASPSPTWPFSRPPDSRPD